MKHGKKIFVAAALSLTCMFAFAGCGGTADTAGGGYVSKPYQYTNPERPSVVLETDPEIKLDGVLDEEIWQNRSDAQWLEFKHPTRENTGVKMTSYIGEKGVYLAFDVDDPHTFVNPEKNIWNNSGMEVYISDASAEAMKTGDGHGYEIDFMADGVSTRIEKQWPNGNGKASWPGYVTHAAMPKGGPINSDDCTGYFIEAFIPNKLLGLDEKPEEVRAYVVPLLCTSYDSSDREWWNYCGTTLGCSWMSPWSWFRFTAQGCQGK